MPSLLNLERFTRTGEAESTASAPQLAPAPAVAQTPEIIEEFDYEIVLDRGQFAGIALVAIVLLAVFSGGAYLIGRSMTPAASKVPPAAPATVAQVPDTKTAPLTFPLPAPTSAPVPATAATRSEPLAAPLLADAVAGKVYLQVGAIEKGLALIWAEGLRTHGLDAFVTSGPSDKQWRVLVGPLPNTEAFQKTKETLDNLGVNTFGRRYEP